MTTATDITEPAGLEMRRCGQSQLWLPALGLGCWQFGGGDYWGDQNQSDVNQVVRRAIDLGVTYFDTAEVYNVGRSETSLGEALQGIARDKLIIGSKISPSNTAPTALVNHCEASLKRLRTDYIDLYLVHWPITPAAIAHFTEEKGCPSVPEAFATLMELRAQGKIRFIGVSNFGMRPLREALDTGAEIAVNELPYNLLARAIEHEILPFCRQNGICVIGYMALHQGVLADIYPTLENVPVWQRRTRHFNAARAGDLCRHKGEGAEKETNEALDSIRAICKTHGMSMPEAAIRWAMANPAISCVLAGSRNVRELEMNVAAAVRPLPAEIVNELRDATDALLAVLGRSFDYYEHPSNDRTK